MTIYLDAVWLLNFLLDMMLLLLTQALIKDNTQKIRIIFGAFIASLLVPISMYFPDTFITSIIGKLLYSVIIILCAFKFYTIYRLVKILFLFYFTSFAIGGGLLAIHFFLQNPIAMSANGLITFNSGFGDPISWIFIVVGFPSVWMFTKVRMDKHAIEKIRYDQLCSVTVQIKGKSFSTTGYIDSGNQLVDPLTKKPVVICDEAFLKQWFTENDWKILNDAYRELNITNLPKDWEDNIHIIPYQGVEGHNKFLFAVRPDQVVIFYEDQKLITHKVLIGIQFGSLTKDQSYHCLIQPQIIKLGQVTSA